MFKALLIEKDEAGKTSASVQEISEDRLPDGDVTVAVEFSTLNYKDGQVAAWFEITHMFLGSTSRAQSKVRTMIAINPATKLF